MEAAFGKTHTYTPTFKSNPNRASVEGHRSIYEKNSFVGFIASFDVYNVQSIDILRVYKFYYGLD